MSFIFGPVTVVTGTVVKRVTGHHCSTFISSLCSPELVHTDEISLSLFFSRLTNFSCLGCSSSHAAYSEPFCRPLLPSLQSVHVPRAGKPRLDTAFQVFLCSVEQGRRIIGLDLLATAAKEAQRVPLAADFQLTGDTHTHTH